MNRLVFFNSELQSFAQIIHFFVAVTRYHIYATACKGIVIFFCSATRAVALT